MFRYMNLNIVLENMRAGVMDKLPGFGQIFQYAGSQLAQTP